MPFRALRGVQIAVSGVKRRVTAAWAVVLTLVAILSGDGGFGPLLAGTLIVAWDVKLQVNPSLKVL